MPKKLRPAVDLMAFKCRTLKVNNCFELQKDKNILKREENNNSMGRNKRSSAAR
jgi:hypothetical protein